MRTPIEDQRGTEQTFLTFPEWFLVHSPAEYAAYVRSHTPSAFPFLGHIRQFWQSYATVSEAANDGYPFNFGYHVMILVIGSSTTVEYFLRSAYENLVGRLSEATQDGGPTPEDSYAARVAQAYVDFIRVKPWYEFDFFGRLAGLWRDTPLTGPDAIRKWERKYALTTEYAIKGAYGWLIGLATEAGYDPAAETTVVVLDRMPDDLTSNTLAKLKVLTPAKPLYHGEVLASLPRYQAFTDTASALAFQGVEFQEIAGNRGPILLSVHYRSRGRNFMGRCARAVRAAGAERTGEDAGGAGGAGGETFRGIAWVVGAGGGAGARVRLLIGPESSPGCSPDAARRSGREVHWTNSPSGYNIVITLRQASR